MKTQIQFTFLFFVLLFSIPVFAQDSIQVKKEKDKKYIKYLNLRFENGAMLGNGSEIGDQVVNSSYYNGFDARLGFRKMNANDVYSNVYRRPYMGVGWYASTFHNSEIGKPHAIFYFLTIPVKFEGAKK